MFTGIIEEIGKIENINNCDNFIQLSIKADQILELAKIGDSVSINGVCLTITSIKKNIFTSDVVKETLEKTNLKYIEKDSYVNLERAMKVNSRFDGHIVQGHIEGLAKILAINNKKKDFVITLEISLELTKYCIYKGSIALNGVSLTISKIDKNIIDICLIPHTLEYTTFQYNKVGDYVNVETDIIGKYIENFQKKYNDCKYE